jgi:hypothetical protein
VTAVIARALEIAGTLTLCTGLAAAVIIATGAAG